MESRHGGCNLLRLVGNLSDYVVDRVLAATHDEASYEATHVVLPRRAIVTVATAATASARLVREACLCDELRHPGAPRIYDCGLSDDGLPWIARELVEGDRCALGAGATPPDAASAAIEIAEMLCDVADVLAYAHARGIIHGNLWLEAIVRDRGTRGFPLCVIDWRRVRRGPAIEGAADVQALGMVAYALLPAGAADRGSRELATLADAMLVPAGIRPSAAAVSARAAALVVALRRGVEPETSRATRSTTAPMALHDDWARGTGEVVMIDDTGLPGRDGPDPVVEEVVLDLDLSRDPELDATDEAFDAAFARAFDQPTITQR